MKNTQTIGIFIKSMHNVTCVFNFFQFFFCGYKLRGTVISKLLLTRKFDIKTMIDFHFLPSIKNRSKASRTDDVCQPKNLQIFEFLRY